MNICIYNFYSVYNINNNMFTPESYKIGADLGRPIIELKDLLENCGYKVNTIDQLPLKDFDIFIFLDFPENNVGLLEQLKLMNKKMILWCLESEIIHPSNININNHAFFDKVLTYNPYNNKKQILQLIPQPYIEDIKFYKNTFSEKKLCTIIAGCKTNYGKNELYSERLKSIIWFSKNRPGDFDLYGTGWENKIQIIKPLKVKIGKRSKKLFELKRNYSNHCYKGTVVNKNEILSKYKFSICLENVKNIPGYVTEKIFDCFFSNCVPIYQGANNITDYIPENCFINYSQFKNPKELYNHIIKIDEKMYNNYLDNIHDFLNSNNYEIFTISNIPNIIENIDNE